MAAIEPEAALADAFAAGKVKRKANTTGQLRARASRVAKGSPEVMVKITGFGRGASHVKSHLDYVTRNGKVELETDRGEVLEGRAEVRAFFKDWEADLGDTRRHSRQRDTMHLVLSMPEGTPQEAVRDAARWFARETFKHHEYVFALHTDELHPHVHLSVKMRSFEGQRLNPRKADLYDWRETFALAMRDQGIDAEATPRPLRGVVRKADRAVVRHIERGDKTHPPRVPKVRAAQVKEAVAELASGATGVPAPEKPWGPPIQARQQATRAAWLAAAASLSHPENQPPERSNARPDYESLDAVRIRAGQRAAAVYQSNLERSGSKAPASAIAGLRNVSRVDLVHHKRPAQVLLLAHAPDRMGSHSPANHDVRWTRVGSAGLADGRERVNSANDGHASLRLADRVEAFVADMPHMATAREALKKHLVKQFHRKAAEVKREASAQPGSSNDVERE
jgi:type IV secretory pathway VirD2 relaxase